MNTNTLSDKVWQDPCYFIAFGFGSGLMPVAPGTWGTLAAIPVYLLIASFPLGYYLGWCLLALLLGIWVSDKVSKDLGVHDYGGIVWDEVVGYLLTMTAVPLGVVWIIAGFLLFRLFDIWKPQPIRLIDRHVKGGLGIMLDDVLAAVPAWLVLQGLVWGFGR
ncbi:phosphatidylglycerophosphatase A family protein [Legionella spiritensis]|uniref:Phosphatidylglycerophosphatase A n=1 Tax=Legionella spiritensis TaxID=452 RepID=A0A0W0YWZ2_LEGSP|nr:phosphatidylglycerophosphatase A [Legionella spiritensis]KTD61364.1 phosphatidylglycerophosphatase A [Legionella spiritensis]SNV33747.1 phosphatidylglycerophosphatase A [Legionella spiritensis]VEG92432.1 phosphatidylglycerophosphatase A [Legionella spiritensis]